MSEIKNKLIDNWEHIKSNLRLEYELSDVSFNTWIDPLIFHEIDEDKNPHEVTVIIPSDNEKQLTYVASKYTVFMNVTISEYLGINCNVSFILEKDAEKYNPKKTITDHIVLNNNYINTNLNSKYLFDTFVVGNSNRLAHTSALTVAESPGTVYNPLFIYSGSGMGKTHLVHAIGHFILKNNPKYKILYATSEDFTNEVIASIRSGNAAKMTELREKYRTVDVLLLDDVQFIIGKESTQEEFFHTFNALHMDNKQIVLTSDKPPKDLEILEDRLRNRFTWGLLADMQPPDYEMRMAILQRNADLQNISFNIEIFDYIARNVTTNVRDLECALNKVIAYTKIENNSLDMQNIEATLKDIIYDSEKREITPKLILNTVADHYKINASDIASNRRNQEFVQPRHVVMYLCRILTDHPLIKIGEILGGKDHTTIKHGYEKIKRDITKNEELKNKIDVILKVINPN